jgi:SAM-dependent methyltransferase
MSGDSSDELLQRVRAGDLDARRILLTPEAEAGAADLTLEALFSADPGVRELGERAWAQLGAAPGTAISRLAPEHRHWAADLIDFWRTAPRDVSQAISPQDGMYSKTPESYFGPGAAALRAVRLAMLETRRERCDSLLDFACGYGRALRFFRAAFPDARLVACDIARDAVDFCAAEFGAVPVYSHEDPAAIELPGPFDVIWVGSLFTHVPEHRWLELLDLLASVLSDQGLLVFTVQGRHVRGQLLSGELSAWSLTDAGIEQIVRGYDDDGFGYADWTGATGYGTTLNRPSWVARRIEERPGLRLVGYKETGWGRQDVVTCQATAR